MVGDFHPLIFTGLPAHTVFIYSSYRREIIQAFLPSMASVLLVVIQPVLHPCVSHNIAGKGIF